jgi:hypothetical protein
LATKSHQKIKYPSTTVQVIEKGELIQLDGSELDWFEGRGPRFTLLTI